MANDNAGKTAALLHEAGEVHHVYYTDVDGNDDDWATFYSEWLLARTKFRDLLARRPVRSGLTRDLVVFDEEYQAGGATDPWPGWYAAKLIQKYGLNSAAPLRFVERTAQGHAPAPSPTS